jgi:hypothetical protein
MSFGDWFRRIFKPGTSTAPAEPEAMAGAPGTTAFADIETAQAVEDIDASTEPPADPAS